MADVKSKASPAIGAWKAFWEQYELVLEVQAFTAHFEGQPLKQRSMRK